LKKKIDRAFGLSNLLGRRHRTSPFWGHWKSAK